LPLYELALMTAERAYDLCQACDLVVVTPESAPMGMFGEQASSELTSRLRAAGVTLRTAVVANVPSSGLVELRPGGDRLLVDRIVTLPVQEGPAVAGLPHDARGFLPVDEHGRVAGVSDVYAAGDAAHHPIKQAGLACQQADAAAEAIAARAGIAIEPKPYTERLQGLLLTEHVQMFLRRVAEDDSGDSGRPDDALEWPPTKIAGRELAPHITGGLPAWAIRA
jgi:sulfide:quinone oxidoreductase